MKIRQKLIISSAILLMLIAFTNAIAIYYLGEVNQTSTVIAEDVFPELECMNKLNFEIARVRSHEYQHMVLSDKEKMVALEDRIDELNTSILAGLDQCMTYGNEEKIRLLKKDWESYMNEHAKIIEASSSMDKDTAMTISKAESKRAYDEITDTVNKLIQEADKEAQAVSERGDVMYAAIRSFLLILVAIALMIGFIMNFMIIRAVTRPIALLMDKLTDLVQHGGDLTKSVVVKSKDEIGELAEAFNQFIQNIRTIIIEVNQCSEEVERSSLQVSEHLQILSKNIEESSGIIEELSAGMEETAAATQEINASSEGIEKAAQDMAERSQDGAISAKEISVKASDLKKAAVLSEETAITMYRDTKNTMETALQKSEAISQIHVLSEAILEISDQTNLLALNAAIEAARAGDAGKGFAVVADEIKKLAENSKNTINEIQKVTEEVVLAVHDLTNGSKEIMDFLDQKVMKDYKEMVHTGESYGNDGAFVDGLVGDFSATAEELTATIEGIIQAIAEVAATVNSGASETQEISNKMIHIVKMLEEVEVQMNRNLQNSGLLKKAVGRFTV